MIQTALLIFAFFACTRAEELKAIVILTPDPGFKDQNVAGTLNLVQSETNGPVTITGKISGLKKDALHGFHVHAKGDLSEGCKSAGPHFNPKKVRHGAPTDELRHVGDLGNIKSNGEGVAEVNITDKIISLCGKNSILGRAIVVHSMEDDLGKGNSSLSKDTGNAGDRWACGLVGVASPEGSWPSSASSLAKSGLLLYLLTIVPYYFTSGFN